MSKTLKAESYLKQKIPYIFEIYKSLRSCHVPNSLKIPPKISKKSKNDYSVIIKKLMTEFRLPHVMVLDNGTINEQQQLISIKERFKSQY